MDAITVEGLSKRYRISKKKAGVPRSHRLPFLGHRAAVAARDVWALRDVSFQLPPGQILGIVGPNGAGKSTLLKVLARVTPPTTGRALVRGRVVSLLELGAGFQPEFSGRENVYLNAAFHGIDRSEVNRRLPAIAEFAELEDAIDRPVKSYSSGMYLRLAFSVAINMDPDILLADEVLAVGDLAFQERCLQRVQEEGREGLTVLFVSHDMAAITRLCNRVMWLDGGVVADEGDPDAIVASYERASWSRMEKGAHDGGGAHAGPHGRIVSARLVSGAGDELGAVRVSDEVQIEITFRIDTPGVALRPGVVMRTEGLVAFRSVAPRATLVPQAGIVRARVRIPPHLLADTEYTIKLATIVDHAGEQTSMAWENALAFRVYDADEASSARGDYHGSLHGTVRPRLEWDIE
jgi:lipopolysaccharide transport system ATP-binding protein